MAQVVEDWYRQMPIITRSYLTLSIVTTVGCALEVISPFHIYLNSDKILKRYEFWRLFTNFFYFGRLDLDFLFHMFFLARYCKLLEETSFRGRTADFFFMLFFGGSLLTAIVLFGGCLQYFSESFARILFLGNSLTFMMVYVWSKRNPLIHMSFLGLVTFTAPYLPWRTCSFHLVKSSSKLRPADIVLILSISSGATRFLYHCWEQSLVDLLGMAAGHAYYFLEDVYPLMTSRRVLKTPGFIKALFPEEIVVDSRPGNAWGIAQGAQVGPAQFQRD